MPIPIQCKSLEEILTSGCLLLARQVAHGLYVASAFQHPDNQSEARCRFRSAL